VVWGIERGALRSRVGGNDGAGGGVVGVKEMPRGEKGEGSAGDAHLVLQEVWRGVGMAAAGRGRDPAGEVCEVWESVLGPGEASREGGREG